MDIINYKLGCYLEMFLEYAQLFIGLHLPLICSAAPRSIIVHQLSKKAIVLTSIDRIEKRGQLGKGALLLQFKECVRNIRKFGSLITEPFYWVVEEHFFELQQVNVLNLIYKLKEMSSSYQQYVCNTSGNRDDSQVSIPFKNQFSDSQTAQWNSHSSFHPNIQQRFGTQYENAQFQSRAFNLLESERESVATSFNEVNFQHNHPKPHLSHDRQSSSKTNTTVQSSVKSLPGTLSLASKFNFRQLITSPSQGQEVLNNLRTKAQFICDKENNLDSSYIRTDEDDLGSQVQLLQVKNHFNSSKQHGHHNHNHISYNNNQANSKESFGLNASEIVPLPHNNQNNLTADESMMFTNLSILGQYLKESEVQSQVTAAEQHKTTFQMHETNINDQSRMTSNDNQSIQMMGKKSFNKDLSQVIVPQFEADSQRVALENVCKQISFSDQKIVSHQPHRSSECFDDKPTQFRSAQQTQAIEVDQPRILNHISRYPYENNYSSGRDTNLYESCKKMLHIPQESICEKIQTLREDISNLFPEQNQSQRDSTRKNETVSSSNLRQQQRVNAQFQQLIKQTNPAEGLQDLIQCRQSFLQQNHSPVGRDDSAHDLISRTEDRIRRSRAERSASKSAQSRSYATNPSLGTQPTQQDDLALLRQEVKSLSDQLRGEKVLQQHPPMHQQCCKHSNQEDEIKQLKQEISLFEQRFKNEVGNIQEHYKAYCREIKTSKSTHINELQAKLEISEKKNFELEAQLKELKLRLEFSESDARKNHVTEGQSRKYQQKLDDLRISYEKLLRNVRAEERDSYHKEMIKLIEANKDLQKENERLRGELFEQRQQQERSQRRNEDQTMRATSERKSSRKRSKGAQSSSHKQQRVPRQCESSPVSHRVKSSSKQKLQIFKTQRASNNDIIKGEASIVTTAQTPKKQQNNQNKHRPQSSRFKTQGLNHSKSKDRTRQPLQERDLGANKQSLKHSSSATKSSARGGFTRQGLQQQIASQQHNNDIPARTSRFNEALFTESDL